MLLHPEPLEGLLPAMVDVMRKLAVNEHDFVRVLVELIADRRDPVENVQRQERRQQRIELEQQVNTLQQERMRLFQARRRAMLEDDAEELATLRTSLAAVEAELAAATDLLSTRGGAPDAAEVSMMDTTLLPVEDDVRSHLHCLAISRLLLERIHEVGWWRDRWFVAMAAAKGPPISHHVCCRAVSRFSTSRSATTRPW